MPYFTPTHTLTGEPRSYAPPTPVVFEELGPQRWEYHTITLDLREDEPLDASALNALGKDGWLLTGTLQHPGREPGRLTYYFVRPATS